VKIDFDLKTTSLEIKTDSTIGSGDHVYVVFHTSQGSWAGLVDIRFTSPPQYYLGWCTSWTNFPVNLPTATHKIWRITKTRTSGIRLVIHCNDVEVLNFLISDSTCGSTSWSTWNRTVTEIYFDSRWDTASDSYRQTIGS
jgi:hypothetical protein